jgi:methyl-accepting chemotaxis protein
MTQQNAALVEETAAAAMNLKAQSDRLMEAVAVFDNHVAAAPRFEARRPAPKLHKHVPRLR